MAQVSFKASVGKVHGLKFNDDNKARFSFSAAENHSRFDKQQNKYIDTGVTWFNITAFGKQAEDLADIIAEGAKQFVAISGRQSTRAYTAQDGSERTSLDVVADNVGIVHRAPQGTNNSGFTPAPASNGGQGDVWGGSGSAGSWETPPAFDNGEAPF